MNETVKEEKIVPIQNAGLIKRTFAGILDFVIMILVCLMFQGFITFPIAKAIATDYDQNYEKTISYYKESNLVLYDKESKQLVQLEESKYLIAAQQYYNVYCASEYEGVHACSTFGKTFREVVEEDKQLVDFVVFNENDSFSFKVPEDSEQNKEQLISAIKSRIYSKALYDLQNSKLFLKSNRYITNVQNYSQYSALAISMLLVYFLPSMISKKGQTVGKLIFKLSVTNQEGFQVKKSQIAVRFLAFAVINVVLGLVTIMIIPLVSFAFMCISKRNSALHDYCAVTRVVDDKASVIYKNRQEFEAAAEAEETRFEEIDNARENYYSSQEK